jgi:hydroxyethylthiazole kinase-like uncharacterized protein yjeF
VRPLAELLAARPRVVPTGGKDTSGTVVVVGGPPTCPGAALLCATAALRVGAGRVQAVVHPEVRAACAAARWELLVEGWDQASRLPGPVGRLLEQADVVVVGPGHHTFDLDVCRAIAEATEATLVLDAAALAATPRLHRAHHLVLAPNTSEAAELLAGVDAGAGEEGTDDERVLAPALAGLTGRPAAVRGPVTVVAGEEGAWCLADPPPGLGTPGSGDVLIGALAGLLAGGNTELGALGWAVALHAAAGRLAGEHAELGYLATDLLDALPAAGQNL